MTRRQEQGRRKRDQENEREIREMRTIWRTRELEQSEGAKGARKLQGTCDETLTSDWLEVSRGDVCVCLCGCMCASVT